MDGLVKESPSVEFSQGFLICSNQFKQEPGLVWLNNAAQDRLQDVRRTFTLSCHVAFQSNSSASPTTAQQNLKEHPNIP